MKTITDRLQNLVNLLDLNPLRAPVAQGSAGDNGQDSRARMDGGIRVLLGGMCNNVHRQLYGDIKTKTGQRIDNAKDRWDKSQSDHQALYDKYVNDPDGLLGDPQAAMVTHWNSVNEERFLAYKDILAYCMQAYKDVTGEVWEPISTSSASAVRRIDPASLSQEVRDRIVASFKKPSVA